MVSTLEKTLCTKCVKSGCIAMCHGCRQSFCTRHFIKHRLALSQQMDDLHEKYELLQHDLHRENFEQSLLSNIYAWERKSIRKIQEIAEKARNDLQLLINKTKNEVQISVNQITSEFESNSKTDNYTETDLEKWTKQLSDLRNLLEKPSTISIVPDKKSSSLIRGIKIIQAQQPSSSSTLIAKINDNTNQERFIVMFGPCKLSEDGHVVTQTNYRAGLSQISGINQYSSEKHSIPFLIEKKGIKNMFIGIHSSTKQGSSQAFDYSVHGWWNLDYVIINGESQEGDNNEIIQTGDKITLIIDCDHQQIQLEHHRTKRLAHLPIKLDVCPFPWKILVRLLTAGDCIRILR